jgi:UDP-N-acetylmuramoyl-tripeptide--D-alanyl-D-alanine ligase
MIQMRLSEAANILSAGLIGDDVSFRGCSTDTRTLTEGSLFIALRGENYDGHDFVDDAFKQGAVAALVESEVSDTEHPLIVVDNSKWAMGDLASAWRSNFTLPVIAVTGSNGKSTVKEMLASILSQDEEVLSTYGNLNNDIGVPLTLFGLKAEHRFAVIEMGANHPGEISKLTQLTGPDIALITLCAPAHIEGFGSIEGVANAKAEIFSGLSENGVAIINADDSYADLWIEKVADKKRLTFGISNSADVSARDLCLDGATGQTEFTLTTAAAQVTVKLNLAGLHNVHNALSAAACCIALNIPLSKISKGLQLAQAVEGRLQPKSGLNGSRIIDDTYNANPASMEAAIKVLTETSKRSWLVMGDMGELGEMAEDAHKQAGINARISGVKRLYAIGELSRHAVDAFGNGAQHFANRESLIAALKPEIENDLSVLVKGSRAMHMEKIVQSLVEED